jgi:hypothetical protein
VDFKRFLSSWIAKQEFASLESGVEMVLGLMPNYEIQQPTSKLPNQKSKVLARFVQGLGKVLGKVCARRKTTEVAEDATLTAALTDARRKTTEAVNLVRDLL